MNRIAAGEVIERPASVVKELVENAIDAGATQIDVAFRGGGKTLIRVSDDGIGMAPEDLALAVERHATSKLADDDLVDIRFLGFRGEALPSIGAVSRLAIASRPKGGSEAHAIAVEGGVVTEPKPAALARGTEIEVKDLFFATPARLKFLKADRSETAEAAETVRRMALVHAGWGSPSSPRKSGSSMCGPRTRRRASPSFSGRSSWTMPCPSKARAKALRSGAMPGFPPIRAPRAACSTCS